MKNTTVTLTFNSERLGALTYHMDKKETDLNAELSDYLQKLYEKYVPQATREYLDDKIDREEAAKTARPRRQTEPDRESGSGSRVEGSTGNL